MAAGQKKKVLITLTASGVVKSMFFNIITFFISSTNHMHTKPRVKDAPKTHKTDFVFLLVKSKNVHYRMRKLSCHLIVCVNIYMAVLTAEQNNMRHKDSL